MAQVKFCIDDEKEKDKKALDTPADPFYSESNMRYLSKIIDGIENGTRPLTQHDLIEVDNE